MFNKDNEYIGISLIDECLKIATFRNTPNDQKVLGVGKKDVRGVAPEE